MTLHSIRLAASLALTLFFGVGALAQSDSADMLFVPLGSEAPGANALPESPPSLRQRFARISPDLLEDAWARAGSPDNLLRLNLFDDAVFDAVVTGWDPMTNGHSLWGHLVGDEASSVVFVANGELVVGTVEAASGSFAVEPAGAPGVVSIRQLDVDESAPGAPPRVPPPAPPVDRAQPIAPPSPSRSQRGAREDGSRIDVLVVYTPAARRAAGGYHRIQTQIELMASVTNLAYERSGVIPRIRVVTSAEVERVESDIDSDLDFVVASAEVGRIRNRNAADAVIMLGVGYKDRIPAWCGLAYLMRYPGPSFEAEAFGVVDYGCRPHGAPFAHELGHIMGVAHDRYTMRVDPKRKVPVADSGAYPYSFGYVNQRMFNARAETQRHWITIMSYRKQCAARNISPCRRILRFSNPDQKLRGILLESRARGAGTESRVPPTHGEQSTGHAESWPTSETRRRARVRTWSCGCQGSAATD